MIAGHLRKAAEHMRSQVDDIANREAHDDFGRGHVRHWVGNMASALDREAIRLERVDRDKQFWYAAQVHQRREDDPVVVTAMLAYRSPEQAKAAVEAMHLVGAEGRDAYVWPPDEAATLSRLPRSQAAYRAIEEEVRRRWGDA